MKKSIFFIILITSFMFFSSGCALLLLGGAVGGVGAGIAASRKSVSQVTASNRENLIKLSVGMTKDVVRNIMGTKTKTAYYTALTDTKKITRGITINNPYRSEILKGKDRVLEVVYYVTDVKSDDGAISDDELTPLIFDEGKLTGWGWNFLNENTQKYEIRMR